MRQVGLWAARVYRPRPLMKALAGLLTHCWVCRRLQAQAASTYGGSQAPLYIYIYVYIYIYILYVLVHLLRYLYHILILVSCVL